MTCKSSHSSQHTINGVGFFQFVACLQDLHCYCGRRGRAVDTLPGLVRWRDLNDGRFAPWGSWGMRWLTGRNPAWSCSSVTKRYRAGWEPGPSTGVTCHSWEGRGTTLDNDVCAGTILLGQADFSILLSVCRTKNPNVGTWSSSVANVYVGLQLSSALHKLELKLTIVQPKYSRLVLWAAVSWGLFASLFPSN